MSFLFSGKSEAVNQADYAIDNAKTVTEDDIGFAEGLGFGTVVEGLHAGLVDAPGVTLSLGIAGAAELAGKAAARKFGFEYKKEDMDKIRDKWFSETTDPLLKDIKDTAPDSLTTGLATQIIYSLANVGGQVAFMGALGTGVNQFAVETIKRVDEGKSLPVSVGLGAIQGLSIGGGAAIPAAIGKTLTQRVASGVVGNVALGEVEHEATTGVLRGAGYDVEANSLDDHRNV
jgi:hypothetical protein